MAVDPIRTLVPVMTRKGIMKKLRWHLEKPPYVWGGEKDVEEIIGKLNDMERLALAKLLCQGSRAIDIAGYSFSIGPNTDTSMNTVDEWEFEKKFDKQAKEVLKKLDLEQRHA